jgi:hypothetical protein
MSIHEIKLIKPAPLSSLTVNVFLFFYLVVRNWASKPNLLVSKAANEVPVPGNNPFIIQLSIESAVNIN